MRLFGMLATAAVLTATAATGTTSANDWSHWRGPEMNGVSRETNLVGDWSLDPKHNVIWTSEIGGRAAPVIFNGRVYLNCRTSDSVTDPKELVNAAEQVVCWDLKTGKELWKDRFNVFETDIPAPRVGWASMTADPESGLIFVHSVSGILRAYTAEGKRVWERSLQEEFGEITGYGGRLTSPLIDEGRLIVAIPCLNWGDTGAPPPKHTFYAFDVMTGKLLWVAAPGGAIEDTFYSNPVVAVIGGVRQIVSGNGDGGVYGINARTGEKLWGMKMSKRGLNSSAVVEGNYVYISHGEDNIDGTEFGRIQCIDGTQRGDLTGTKGVWQVRGVKAGYASPTIHEGILYVVSDVGGLIAYDAKKGEKLWEYKIGTVGKGSPVWADGKIYVMEVNGRIHVLKVSRAKCEKISEVQLTATGVEGTDEIYGSPAISDGHVVFSTRDRTICVGDPSKAKNGDVPAMAEELPLGEEIASVQLRPYETDVNAGESVEFEVHAFDKNGRFLKTVPPDDFALKPADGLKGATVAKNKLTTAADAKSPQADIVTVDVNGKTAKARIRSYPPLPWTFDFTSLNGRATPAGWVGATGRITPNPLDGDIAMKSAPGPGKPAFTVWLGPPRMKNYIVEADVRCDGKRRLSSIGLTNQRYDMVLKANNLKLTLQTWPAHLRINQEEKIKDPAGKWYRLKFAVDVKEGTAHLRGKMWPRGEQEPQEWTIETTDPHPNELGSPGLYVYRLDEAYFDNVKVSAAEGAPATVLPAQPSAK